MERINYKKELLKYLKNHKGKKNAVYSKEIEYHYGIPGAEVRQMVNELRSEGYPICSGTRGYWIAEDTADLMATMLHLVRRKQGLDKAIEGLRKAIGWTE